MGATPGPQLTALWVSETVTSERVPSTLGERCLFAKHLTVEHFLRDIIIPGEADGGGSWPQPEGLDSFSGHQKCVPHLG